MRPSEWHDFCDDIASRGVNVPIEILADGTVLDGRHRLRAALELGIVLVPVMDAPLGNDDPRDYMLRAAVLRRHLTDDQRAAMAAMWKDGHGQRPGPKTKDEKDAAQRCAEIDEDDPKLGPTRAAAVQQFVVTRRKVDIATKLLNEAPDLLTQVHQGDISLKEAEREIRKSTQVSAIARTKPPVGKWPILVVDPPWPYSNRSDDISHRAALPYPSMSIEEIKALRLPATDDCILWLWTTNAFMHDAFHVLEVWGFAPKTILTWVKNRMGLGDWLRGQTEHCILAVRGKPIVTLTNQTTLLHAPMREHSRKPNEFYTLVEALCPGSKCELFAREQRSGWDTFGAEAGRFGTKG
jgi:N6-adenosine-specific RNA methylase IME4